MSEPFDSRREFVKKAVYVAPAVLTLRAAPAYAKAGSEKHKPKKDKREQRGSGGRSAGI